MPLIRKGLRPGLRVGTDLPGDSRDLRRVMPFRKSWIAIGILAAMDTIFIIPAVATFTQAADQWGRLDDLFDLVGALFLSAWLLGWSIAPLIMTTILVLLLFGRETLRARTGAVHLFIGVPFLGLWGQYDVSKMRNLRIETPPKKSGKSWRGNHFAFDYGANTVAFGSDIEDGELAGLEHEILIATAGKIRRGEALPGELREKWEAVPEEPPPPEPVQSAAAAAPVSLSSPSSLLLIIANLIPPLGTVFLGWKLSDVMVIYWAESAVIGFFNLCKISVIGRWAALAAGPFFLGHFGAFMAVHFLFIYTLFVKGIQDTGGSAGELADVAQLFIGLWPALAALFISHGFSFFRNFMGRHEFRGRTLRDQMSEPYNRIIFMHLVLIFGGGLTLILGEPTLVLIFVIALKIYFDLKAHLREHTRDSPAL